MASEPEVETNGESPTSGIVLMVAAAVALAWANSPWSESYEWLWRTPVAFQRSLEWLVNDGLMVIFFFAVGLEIRKEIHDGELSEVRRAALPAAAALGGMLAPAALYTLIAGGTDASRGWGVPMATDIAFAVGILALLGKRVPPALRVLLLALAVIDDLGAIVVIALFYSGGISALGLLIAVGGFGAILLMQRVGVRAKWLYVLPAVVAWAGVYRAGVHPTIAGVIVGLLTPVRALPGEAESPAASLVKTLHPWVTYAIMPLFALANAGVALEGRLEGAAQLAASGIVVGLVLGKPLGVLLACALTLKLGLAKRPHGVSWRELVVLGCVAGVGFTMSLFVAQLAFAEPALLASAKLSVLVASVIAGVLSLAVGRLLLANAASARPAP